MKSQYADMIWESYIAESIHSKENSCKDDEYFCDEEKICKKKSDREKDVKAPVEENSQLLVIASELISQLVADAENGYPSRESKELVQKVYDSEPELFDPDVIRGFAKKAGMDEFEAEFILPDQFQKHDDIPAAGSASDMLGYRHSDWEADDPDQAAMDRMDREEGELPGKGYGLHGQRPKVEHRTERGKPELIEDQDPEVQFEFESRHPISMTFLDVGEIGYGVEGPDDKYYWVEAELHWDGAYYKARYSGTTAAEEPDEEPYVDQIVVVLAKDQETDQEVDEATYKALEEWSENKIQGLGASSMMSLGWEPDDGY